MNKLKRKVFLRATTCYEEKVEYAYIIDASKIKIKVGAVAVDQEVAVKLEVFCRESWGTEGSFF